MTKTSTFTKISVILAILLSQSARLSASHIVAAELYYTWISGSTYKISMALFGDCGIPSSGAFRSLQISTPQVCVYNGTTLVTSLTLAIDTPVCGNEVSAVCPDSIGHTQCTSTTYTLPGIKKFIYSTTYTFPSASSAWRLIYTSNNGSTAAPLSCGYTGTAAPASGGRAAAITNITPGTLGSIQLIDTLDNTTGHNSSPIISEGPTPYYCLNHSDYYDPGVTDPDGDSLDFSLVSATLGANTCGTIGGPVTYATGLSPAAPLICAAGTMTFNNSTGRIDFFPNATQRGVVVYNIREYRGGVLIGSCQREMTFLVLACTNMPGWGVFDSATAGNIIDTSHYAVCTGTGAFSVYLDPRDPNAGDIVNVTASGLPTGATFNTVGNGTDTPHCTFSWNTTGVTPGIYTFSITCTDGSCPIANLIRTYTIEIDDLPAAIGGTPAVGIGGTTTLTNSVTGGTWSSSNTAVATVSSSGVVTGVAIGTCTISYTMPGGCYVTQEVTLDAESAIEDQYATTAYTVYPNPAKSDVTITWAGHQAGANATLSLTDVTGREVMNKTINMTTSTGNTHLKLKGIKPGAYFLSIRSAAGNYNTTLTVAP